jgi:hypothetical protein
LTLRHGPQRAIGGAAERGQADKRRVARLPVVRNFNLYSSLGGRLRRSVATATSQRNQSCRDQERGRTPQSKVIWPYIH